MLHPGLIPYFLNTESSLSIHRLVTSSHYSYIIRPTQTIMAQNTKQENIKPGRGLLREALNRLMYRHVNTNPPSLVLADPVSRHRSESAPTAACLQPTVQQQAPSSATEGHTIPSKWNNPNIPPNESPSYLEPIEDPSDRDLRIFRTIEKQISNTLHSMKPLIVGGCTYGTAFVDDTDLKFNPYLHPKIIGIIMGSEYIGRWREIDSMVMGIIFEAYGGSPPPVRYYVEDFALL